MSAEKKAKEAMSDLMQRRFKCIGYGENHYPNSPFKVGQILIKDATHKNNYWTGDQCYTERHPQLYPHLFKELQWYDGRSLDEMPEYVKLEMNGKIQFVHKVEKWKGVNDNNVHVYDYFNRVNYLSSFCVDGLEPATLEEYNQYIQSKTNNNDSNI